MFEKFAPLAILSFVFLWACNQKADPNAHIQDLPKEKNYSAELRLKTLSDAIAQHPEKPELYYQRGLYLLELNRGEEAYKDAEKGLEFDGNNCLLWYLKAKAIITIPNLEQSLIAAHKAEELQCKSAELQSFLGELYFIKKDYDKALGYVNKAISIDKYDPHSYFYKGLIYKEKGDSSKAISNLQTVIELKPEYIDAYNELAIIYYARADYKTGYQYLQSGLRFDPKDPFVNYNIGMYHYYTNAKDTAATWFEKALFYDAKLASASYMLGLIIFDKQDYSNAYKYFSAAVASKPDYLLASYYLAMSCEYLNKLPEAIQAYTLVAENENKYQESARKRIGLLNQRLSARSDSTRFMK